MTDATTNMTEEDVRKNLQKIARQAVADGPPRREHAQDAQLRDMVAKLEPGMTVIWHESGNPADRQGRVGIVLEGAGKTLVLAVIDKEVPHAWYKIVSGCKHYTDRDLSAFEKGDQGAWEMSVFLKRLFDLLS